MTKHEEGRTTSSTSTVALCQAMKKAGITDADSKEGIEFCTETCPYPDGCIVANEKAGPSRLETEKEEVRRLWERGLSYDEIALIIKKSSMTVRRYLKT